MTSELVWKDEDEDEDEDEEEDEEERGRGKRKTKTKRRETDRIILPLCCVLDGFCFSRKLLKRRQLSKVGLRSKIESR